MREAPHSLAPWMTDRPTPPIPKMATCNKQVDLSSLFPNKKRFLKKEKKKRRRSCSRAGLNFGGVDGSSVAGGDAAAQEADLAQGCVVGNLGD